ncbi:hypothetical protein Cgig2_029386 [Carnegiea gigantea]|uniref:Transcription repressor n=1 Tax=Carnegiea gigantea TaxID=171969 RepID=A0A9Q1KW74_9CARY|nr:hypothetical protein Cgig2_029386 [Carnegiea gigantea]
MMKWGRKKHSSASISSASSSSSHPHLISHVFPLSWFSKSKQISPKPTSRTEKFNQKGKQNWQKTNQKSPKCSPSTYRDNRFYAQDDDGFWMLSFGDQHRPMEGDHSSKLVVRQDSCGNCKSNVKQPATKRRSRKSNKKHCDRELREVSSKEVAKDESLQRTYRRIIEATSELQRELDEVTEGCRKSVEKEMQEIELLEAMQMMGRRVNSDARKQRHVSSRGSESFHRKEDEENVIAERQKLKEAKVKEFLAKSEKQRKSFHISRDSQIRVSRQGKVRVQSPRTPSKTESCKIKALEDLKKLKMKKKMKEIASFEDKAAALDSFAIVKCSRNPQQDFRDSMLEMIMEKRIRRPEELEELLACYLSLNADEYHDLIIKVFRQPCLHIGSIGAPSTSVTALTVLYWLATVCGTIAH